jgi:hypothetical protein
MSKNGLCKRVFRTYPSWDLCNGGKEEPKDTLTNGKHVIQVRAQVAQPRGTIINSLVSKGGV